MATLTVCEVVILRLYNLRIIGMAYLPVWKVEAKVEWMKLLKKYNCETRKFERLLDHLYHYRLVDDHGKRKEVVSLSPTGTAYAVSLAKMKKFPDETII
jgi:hypothetical protein